MLISLVKKECSMWMKSIVFYAYVIILVVFYISQMEGGEIIRRPQPETGEYGYTYSDDEKVIMDSALRDLFEDFYSERPFTTYPIGFYKQVTLSEGEREQVAACISRLCGMSQEEWEEAFAEYSDGYSVEYDELGRPIVEEKVPFPIVTAPEITYEQFEEIMEEVAGIIGPGSDYEKEQLKGHGVVEMTYEQALSEYENILYKDKISGAYARLFCDYMGIILGLLPVFFSTARVLRDKRSQIKEVVYAKKAETAAIVCSRYLGIVIMIFLPVLLLSFLPMSKSVYAAKMAGVSVDYLALVKYAIGWLLPTILFVTALAYMITELTEGFLTILVGVVVWFTAIFSADTLQWVGWNLIPRFNSLGEYNLFSYLLPQLVKNRIFYTAAALVLLGLTLIVYGLKRKGVLKNGKVSENLGS